MVFCRRVLHRNDKKQKNVLVKNNKDRDKSLVIKKRIFKTAFVEYLCLLMFFMAKFLYCLWKNKQHIVIILLYIPCITILDNTTRKGLLRVCFLAILN